MNSSNILTEISFKKLLFKFLHPIKDIKQTYAKLQSNRKWKQVMKDPEFKRAFKDYEEWVKDLNKSGNIPV